MKKKIVILCSSYPPERGAAPSRMYHLATMLAAQGFEIEVITAIPNYPTGKIFPNYRNRLLVREQVEDISVTRIWMIPTNSSRKIKRGISLLSYVFSLFTFSFYYLWKAKPDLLLVSSPPFVTGYFGTLFARVLKVKCLLNVSDIWPQSAFDLGFIKEGWLYTFLQNREHKMYARADFFSVQSKSIKNHIAQYFPMKSSFVYRNLQPHNSFAKQERPYGTRKIIYAGLLGIAQGVFEIVKQVNFAAMNTELHIYGQGFQRAAIQKWINDNPERKVFYHGSVAPAEMPEIFTNYHAMLIPLATEIKGAVPSKIFNAMANGLPIVFCGSGEAAAIIQQSKTGYCSNSSDYVQLSENIKKLVEMSVEEYELMRKNCVFASENSFSKTKQDCQFVSFLQKIIN